MTSPVTVILQPGYSHDAILDKTANLIREITGKDPAARVNPDGTTTVYASSAPAYPRVAEPADDDGHRAW